VVIADIDDERCERTARDQVAVSQIERYMTLRERAQWIAIELSDPRR